MKVENIQRSRKIKEVILRDRDNVLVATMRVPEGFSICLVEMVETENVDEEVVGEENTWG
jgi:hypothetical protein